MQPERAFTVSSTAGSVFAQCKLTVGEPGDEYERQADTMTNTVMNMSPGNFVQRKCAHCEEEEKKQVQRKTGDNTSFMQARSDTGHAVPPVLAESIQSSQGKGASMDSATASFMSERFGTDFSRVKLHTGSDAVQMSRDLNARAFTVGNDIYFNEGEYQPGSDKGKQLLAHELTHTLQQNGGINKKIQKLGANPGCTPAEIRQIHQAIFDARGWIRNALTKLESSPLHRRVIPALRRNFGPTYGVEANIPLIAGRIRAAFRTLGIMEVACDTPGTTDACAANHCGWAVAGSDAVTICTNPTSTLDIAAPFAIHCILHESFHAAMSFMTVDHYKDDAGYPGAATDPLLNADSYTHLVRELS